MLTKPPPPSVHIHQTEGGLLFGGLPGDGTAEEQEGGPTRRGFINRIFTGISLALSGLGLLLLISAPGLERLAYLSFASLFEEGIIFLTNNVYKVWVCPPCARDLNDALLLSR